MPLDLGQVKKAAVVVGALLLSSLVLEAVLWSFDFPATPVRVANPPNLAQVRNNIEFQYHFATNRMGLRSREIPLTREPGRRRVFVVGDSFTEGVGVESDQTFAALLERSFTNAGQPVDFVNAGLAGAGPEQYARVFMGIGLRYRPDGLLICVFQNDVANMPEQLAPLELHPETWAPSSALKRTFFHLYPRLYVLGFRVWHRAGPDTGKVDIVAAVSKRAREIGIPEETITGWKAHLPPHLVEAANKNEFNDFLLSYPLLHPRFVTDALDIDSARADRQWRSMVVALDEMVRVARLNNVAVGVLYLPSSYQYDASEFSVDNLEQRLGMVLRDRWLQGDAEVQRRLGSWASRAGVPILDLTEDFRTAMKRGQRLNWMLDGHWNPEGNEVAAGVIQEWLQRQQVFPFLK